MAKLVIQEGNEVGREIQVEGRIVLGREGQWAIKDTKISRQHSRVFVDGDEVVIADLNSRNGTLVNGRKITRHSLRNGDRIRVGNTIFEFVSEAPEHAPEPEPVADVTTAGDGGAAATPGGGRPDVHADAVPRSGAAGASGRAATSAATARPGPGGARATTAQAPSTVATGSAPVATPRGAEIVFTDGGEREGALWEDLGQRNFAYKAGMVVLALATAVILFYLVAFLSEQMFG